MTRDWVETRLILPFIPFGFDFAVRALALNTKLVWWQIPDLKTLAITTSFFCFLLAVDLKGVGKIPSDADYHAKLDGLRRRFVTQGIVSTIIFGIVTGLDVAEKYFENDGLSKILIPVILCTSIAMFIVAVLDSISANLKYRLSYNA